jgi:hypothetical protein
MLWHTRNKLLQGMTEAQAIELLYALAQYDASVHPSSAAQRSTDPAAAGAITDGRHNGRDIVPGNSDCVQPGALRGAGLPPGTWMTVLLKHAVGEDASCAFHTYRPALSSETCATSLGKAPCAAPPDMAPGTTDMSKLTAGQVARLLVALVRLHPQPGAWLRMLTAQLDSRSAVLSKAEHAAVRNAWSHLVQPQQRQRKLDLVVQALTPMDTELLGSMKSPSLMPGN